MPSGSAGPPLDIAEWSYFFVGVERAELARGTVTNGQQMYVEYQIPAVVKYPYPIVLVHGGGGQGLDWMGTPDGRRGWATILLEQGYKVYIVDRPGHGRAPYHPEVHGAFGPTALTLETLSGRFTPPNANAPDQGPLRKAHNQWPGTGEVGSPDLSQMVASQGGSYGGARQCRTARARSSSCRRRTRGRWTLADLVVPEAPDLDRVDAEPGRPLLLR